MNGDNGNDISFAEAIKRARTVATRYMTRTARSYSQVTNRLSKEGFADEVIQSVLNEFVTNGTINDQELARRWVEDRATRKQYGARRLIKELETHGVSRETAEQAMTQLDLETEVQNAQTAVSRRWHDQALHEMSPLERQRQLSRCSGFLFRRGYSTEVIRQVLKNLT